MRDLKMVLVIVLVGVVVVFSVQNAAQLELNFLFWTFSSRRVIILFLVLAIGILVGWVWRSRMQHLRDQKELKSRDGGEK